MVIIVVANFSLLPIPQFLLNLLDMRMFVLLVLHVKNKKGVKAK